MKKALFVTMALAGLCGCQSSRNVEKSSFDVPPAIYVAPHGDDGRLGMKHQPMASLAGARDYLRKSRVIMSGPIVIEFAEGTYRFTEPALFEKRDGGDSEEAPVIYRAAKGARVRFTGAVPVTGWQKVTDEAVLAQLPEAARKQVLVANLQEQDITDYGRLTPRGFGKVSQLAEAELLYDRVPMSLSRWPKSDWLGVDVVDEKNEWVTTNSEGRMARWVNEKDPWIFSYWHVDWAESYEPIAGLDPGNERLRRAVQYKPYADKISPGRVRCYALNLLSELENPGEYYLDREAGLIYFIPPYAGGTAELTLASGLVSAKDCSYLRFEGIEFDGVRGRAIHFANAVGCAVVGCTIRATAFNAISMNGSHNEVYGCDVFDTGEGGIYVSGGDRKTLTDGKNNVENNHVHDYSRRARTYKTGITVAGCGNRMAHNLVHHGPHMALSAPGNNHLLEFNEVHNAVYESGDAGAYYVGRDWTQRGNILLYNFWHNIMGSSSYGGMTIYLDDQHCGHTIFGNIFYRCNKPVFIGGGDDNKVLNNVFIDSHRSAHLDNRGMGWQKKFTDDTNSSIHKALHAMPYQGEIWAKAYPELVNVLDDDPGVPKRNVFARNVHSGGPWDSLNKETLHLQTVEDNLVREDDKDFAQLRRDKQGQITELRFKDPEAVAAIGFEPIPVEKIGLYKDPRRASWPVTRRIDPVELPHDGKPMPGSPAAKNKARTTPTLKVPRGGSPRSEVMELAYNYTGELVKPPAQARFSHDGTMLYVSVTTPLAKKRALGDGWAGNEAVELCFKGADGPNADTYVLRGFTSGATSVFKIVGSGSHQPAEELAAGIVYSAKVEDAAWSCRWAVPLKAMAFSAGDRLWANVTVRRTAGNHFVMWLATYGDSTNCDSVGYLELAP
ncbi:MAG: right-handed parallel beta-helix repeat-containing protein [Lentisphaeria bacterium]|jgi:hypothetical protein